MAFTDRVRNVWNAFRTSEAPVQTVGPASYGSSSQGDRSRRWFGGEKTIITSIYTRIAIDVSSVELRHVKVDDRGRYSEDMKTRLNAALTVEPNLDQGPTAFRRDIVLTMFEHGHAAIVPVDTSVNPRLDATFDIYTMRVGHVVNWYPAHVRVRVYNEKTGIQDEVILEKKFVAIIENPLFAVMNEPSSTLRRLVRKLSLLDAVDEASGSGRLDLIIQLPYIIKSEASKTRADDRRAEIERQLKESSLGIAYADATEKIVQLNRPIENNLMKQIEFLTDMLYSELGVTATVMNGTADEPTMTNYHNRTVDPILVGIVEGMNRTFLGGVSVRKNEKVRYFRNFFKYSTLKDITEFADVASRNEIAAPNEIRDLLGWAPADDPNADKLQNSNMPQPGDASPSGAVDSGGGGDTAAAVASAFDEVDSTLNSIFADLGAANG